MAQKNSINFFKKDGILTQKLPQYEYRSQQIEMAERIEMVLVRGAKQHLIIEAGTGTGKSLAYLVPFIYWATKNNKRFVVSTYTKALQEQLIKIDLPFLQQIMDVDFNFALCVGSNNYLCLRRLSQTQVYGLFNELKEVEQFNEINKWQEISDTGLKSELRFEPLGELWSKLSRESDLCMGKNCIFFQRCFYFKAKKKQILSQVLVANHHLFFADLVSGNQVLPEFEAIVFDEAHTVEDVATNYLGLEVSNSGIRFILDRLYNHQNNKGLISRMSNLEEKLKQKIIEHISVARNSADKFFLEILGRFNSSQKSIRLKEKNFIDNIIEPPLSSLISSLTEITKTASVNEEEILEVNSFIERCRSVQACLKVVIEQENPNFVYWLEISDGKRLKWVTIHANPIEINNELKAKVFDVNDIVVLTSATLAVNRSFAYIKNRLGLSENDELLLDSPFDYPSQVILYTPTSIPDPKIYPASFEEKVGNTIEELLCLTKGRAFILFTSYAMLNKIHQQVTERLPELNHYKQGEVTTQQMVEIFKQKDKPVLWGTNTFWQGIDVPGDSLVCVVITKLPFAVPDDPITEARMEWLNQNGLNPFWEYQVPQAVIQTKQGFGRLIRKKDDYGIVSILDPRIKTKSYGKLFLDSLPHCQQAIEFEELKQKFCSMCC